MECVRRLGDDGPPLFAVQSYLFIKISISHLPKIHYSVNWYEVWGPSNAYYMEKKNAALSHIIIELVCKHFKILWKFRLIFVKLKRWFKFLFPI